MHVASFLPPPSRGCAYTIANAELFSYSIVYSFASAAEELEYYKNYATKVECDLAEVQLTLEEFQMSSKELEEELEKEVENTERRYNEIRIRNEAMRQEVEEWKV